MAEDSLPEKSISPEEEVRALELKLQEKKRELAEKGVEFPHEKEVLREVLKTHIEQSRTGQEGAPLASVSTPTPSSQPLTPTQQQMADDLKKKEERKEQVQALIEYALTRTIEQAVKIAENATPWLLDELHDHLVDDYYEKLVALRKIKDI